MVPLDRIVGDRTGGELGLLAVFLVVATYAFVAAGNYQDTIGLYPRALSAVVLGCTLLLLFQNLLPRELRAYVAESADVIGSADIPEAVDREKAEAPTGQASGAEGMGREQLLLTGLIGGYLLLSYLVGMYVATPVFVLVYGGVYRLGWRMAGLLTAGSWLLAHLFLVVFDAPIASGILI
jgi:hypothetical protein